MKLGSGADRSWKCDDCGLEVPRVHQYGIRENQIDLCERCVQLAINPQYQPQAFHAIRKQINALSATINRQAEEILQLRRDLAALKASAPVVDEG